MLLRPNAYVCWAAIPEHKRSPHALKHTRGIQMRKRAEHVDDLIPKAAGPTNLLVSIARALNSKRFSSHVLARYRCGGLKAGRQKTLRSSAILVWSRPNGLPAIRIMVVGCKRPNLSVRGV